MASNSKFKNAKSTKGNICEIQTPTKLKRTQHYNHLPTANTQSYPDCTKMRASMRAVEPEEQLLLTLNTGTPVRPISNVEANRSQSGNENCNDCQTHF